MLKIAAFRGDIPSDQFNLWLEQLYIHLQASDVQKNTIIPAAATDPATTMALVNDIADALISVGILKR